MRTTVIPVRVLLVEDNRADAALVQRRLAAAARLDAKIDAVEWLSTATTALQNRSYDVILLDLTLPDSTGIDTVAAVVKNAPNIPVIVLSGREDIETATNSVRAGAQSFVVKKPEISGDELEREILYAMERVRHDVTSKELMLHSVQRLTVDERPDSRPTPSVSWLLSEHITRIDATMVAVRDYLVRNYPSAAEGVDSILDLYSFYAILQEARSLLRLDSDAETARISIQDRAERAFLAMDSDEAPRPGFLSTTDAEAALLHIIGQRDE